MAELCCGGCGREFINVIAPLASMSIDFLSTANCTSVLAFCARAALVFMLMSTLFSLCVDGMLDRTASNKFQHTIIRAHSVSGFCYPCHPLCHPRTPDGTHPRTIPSPPRNFQYRAADFLNSDLRKCKNHPYGWLYRPYGWSNSPHITD